MTIRETIPNTKAIEAISSKMAAAVVFFTTLEAYSRGIVVVLEPDSTEQQPKDKTVAPVKQG